MFNYYIYGYFEAVNESYRVSIKLPIRIESERELLDFEADSNMLGYCIDAEEDNNIHRTVMVSIAEDLEKLFNKYYGYKVRANTDLHFAYLFNFRKSRFGDASSYESTMIKLHSDSDDIENVIPFFMLNRISENHIIKL